MDGPLTQQQTKLLLFIRDYITTHGYPPSVRDMLPVGPWVSTSSVAHQLRALTAKGHITYRNSKSRTITVLDGTDTETPMDKIGPDAVGTIITGLRLACGPQERHLLEQTAQRIVAAATEPGATELVVLAVGSEVSARRLLDGATLAFPPPDPVAPTEKDMAEARLVLTQLAATYQETRTDGTRLRDLGQETATP